MVVLQYMRLPRQKKFFKVCKPCVTHKMCKTGMNCQLPMVAEKQDLPIGYKGKKKHGKNARRATVEHNL